MRYFKTTSPSLVAYTPGGMLRWETEDGDVGYYATDNPGTLKAIDKFLESRKPGNTPVGPPVEEIPQAEYDEFVGKSKGRRWSPDREYIKGTGLVPASVPRSQTVDAPAAAGNPLSAVVPTINPAGTRVATPEEAQQLDATLSAPETPPAPAPTNLRRRNAK